MTAPPAGPAETGEGGGLSGSLLFHLALVAGLAPVAGVPIVALLAIAARRKHDARERRWARRIAGVLLVDLVVAAIVIATSAGALPAPAEAAQTSGPRIGVAIDDDYAGEGIRVDAVLEGSPADRAGLAEGDVIVGADGASIASLDDLRSALGRERVVVDVRRAGEALQLEVEPTSAAMLAGERCGEVRARDLVPERGTLISFGVVVLGTLALGAIGWRRRARGGVATLLPFLAIPPLGALVGAGAAVVACSAGADTLVIEISLVASEVVLVALAALAVWGASRRWEGETPTLDGDAPLSVPRTVALGVLYVATWIPRVLFLAAPLFVLAREHGMEGGSEALGVVLGGDRAPIALVLTFIAGALLAPIGEELLFRGLLVPWLARVVAPWAAIVLSALLFGALHDAHGIARIGPMTIGVVLGWARLRAGTLAAPIAIHVIVNATALTIGWLTS